MKKLKLLLAVLFILIIVAISIFLFIKNRNNYGVNETDKIEEEIDAESNTKDQIEFGEQEIYYPEGEPEEFLFRDVFGEEYKTIINPNIEKTPYDNSKFLLENGKMSYSDGSYSSKLGVDVSHHQGNINWDSVKAQGYDFAILRIAFRGYGKTGALNADREFENNYKEATKAGLDVGVYIFSQAISESEAIEEAEYVLSIINGRKMQLPVVYDPESILDDEARTDNVTGEQFTKNTKAFCERIEKEGYKPMIYSNMLWEAYNLNLEELPYPVWYADYERYPQTSYNFEFWQYTNEGKVEGISGDVDLNIWLVK